MKYNSNDIIKDKWAKLRQMPDGKYQQVWNIVLKNPINCQINVEKISQSMSHNNFYVLLKIEDSTNIIIYVTFAKDMNIYGHDPVVMSSFKLFKDIVTILGDIDTIEGQKMEDRWSPFENN